MGMAENRPKFGNLKKFAFQIDENFFFFFLFY
jgi:hypothetical protein